MTDGPLSPPDSPPWPGAGLMALGFFTQGTEGVAGPDGVEQSGGLIGRYELLEPLGEGGFGVVWRARQHQPMHRDVALKVIKPGMGSREVICRFEAERQALALMDHPNIAAVLDAGATPDGRPYFVMELVQGQPITDYCDRHQLPLRDRLALFIPVCQAVQHAHQKSVLHRDLKPSNILVTEVDGKPVPKVIDFGIAKALGPAAEGLDESHPDRTRIGTVVGTPRYMSPEQAGCGLDVDTRSDVYSLGVVLCELLTGQTPLPAASTDLAGALRSIFETASVRPSTLVQTPDPVVEQTASRRRLDHGRLLRALRGDLDWITLKAMEKDRTRRYETATALARDLQRHLEGKTVSAAAPVWHYQLGKFARRHRTVLIAAGLAAVALLAGMGVSLWQASQAKSSRIEAERNRLDAEANFDRARQAVELYLGRVNDHPRLQQADFQDLQRDLMETALPFYEELSHLRGQHPRLRMDRSQALARLAPIYQSVGRMDQSEAAWQDSLELASGLAAEFPGDPLYQQTLAERYSSLATLLLTRSRREEALTFYRKAEEVFLPLISAWPDRPEYVLGLSIATRNKGTALNALKRGDEAKQAFSEAGSLAEKLTAAHPDEPAYLQQSAANLMTLGDLYKAAKDYRTAEASCLESIRLQEKIVSGHPELGYRRILVLKYLNYGQMLCLIGRNQEGVDRLQQGLTQGQQLVDEFPTYNGLRSMMVQGLTILWQDYDERGLLNEARSTLERLRLQQTSLTSAVPQSKEYREELALTLEHLKDLAARQEKVPAGTATDMAESESKSPREFLLDYPLGKDAGVRRWVRVKAAWTETQPSGQINKFTAVRRLVVDGVRGTEIRRNGGPLDIFVPDQDTPPPFILKLRSPDGTWGWLGTMTGVE
ncbi:MAG: serine/threonine-protein kinase [Verrucomicrobiota bacterium]